MTISVIIPTLNEEQFVAATLKSVVAAGPCEIIVADCGSSDRTKMLASAQARVVESECDRARQMNVGARHASGDILLFLHADTLLPANAFASIRTALARADVVAGCFRLTFASESSLLRFYAAWTALPLKSLCFGDRALFVRRDVFLSVGGFPEIPVFEDLEMVRTLAAVGKFAHLTNRVTTSPRRFDQYGAARQQLRNAYMWIRYQLGTHPERLAALYPYPEPDSSTR